MNETERWNTALMIAIKDLEHPNKSTRAVVAEGDVWEEFYKIREELIRHAHTLLEFTDEEE